MPFPKSATCSGGPCFRMSSRENHSVTEYEPLYLAGIEQFNRQAYFESHEIWEALWNVAPRETKHFYQGLIQAAVALDHLSRENLPGAQKLAARSRVHLAPYGPWYLGLDIERFVGQMSLCVENRLRGLDHSALLPTIRLGPIGRK